MVKTAASKHREIGVFDYSIFSYKKL